MVINFKCESCGADLLYEPEFSQLQCPHCEHAQMIAEDDMAVYQGVAEESSVKEYHCCDCGSVLLTQDNTTSLRCEYCEAPLILADRLKGSLRPRKIIPFKITHKMAEEAFKKWCRNGRFAPPGFTSANSIKNIKGLYVPYWLFNMDADVEVSGTASKLYIYRLGDTEYTETSYYQVHRKMDLSYHNIPHDASSHLDDKVMSTLEPFDFSEVKAFNMPYLSGFVSEKYDLTDEEVKPVIKQRVEQYGVDHARSTINGYSSVNLTDRKVNIKSTETAYTLMPVWFFEYHYKGRDYQFLMNGQTGKVVGSYPMCGTKILRYIGIFTGIFTVIYTLASFFGGAPIC